MRITRRILTPDESQRAIDAGGPLQDLQLDPVKLADMTICVVEVDGTIAAYWVLFQVYHAEPLWIHPTWRKSPSVVRGIVDQLHDALRALDEAVAYCEIQPENLEVVGDYARRLGFQEAPGKLFYIMTPALESAGA